MASKRKGRRPLTEAEQKKIVKMKGEGRRNQDIAKALGVADSTVTRVIRDLAPKLAGHSAKIRNGKAKKPPAVRRPDMDDEKAYLLWALHGALRGWADRLIKDIASDRFIK